MSENEAKEILEDIWNFAISANGNNEYLLRIAINTAIKALEEKTMLNEIMHELSEYQAIGTVEELKDLKEKSVAKKPIMATNMMLKNRDFICPNCEIKMPLKFKYCNHCGQKLDWK